jgi:itaconate CoA-transferase
MLGLQNEREWLVFCDRVLGRPEVAADPRFSSNSRRSAARRDLNAIISKVFSQLTTAQVIERLDSAQIANARMNDMRAVWSHPQLETRGRWVDIDTPAGKIPALLPPGIQGEYMPRMDAVPAVGEHTESILGELGYDSDAIAQLRAQQAV